MEGLSREEKFRAAVNVIRSLPKKGSFQPSNELMLKFYSYYKQATEGPCNIAKPSFWDIVNKAKWEAWKGLGNMPKEEAMEHYIDELKKIVETMSFTQSVAEFVDVLGPFYEFVPLEETEMKSNGNQESDEENNIIVNQTVENEIESLDGMSVAESLKKQLKNKKLNGDIRNDAINNRQLHDALNSLNSTNGHKENGTEESETDEFSDTYDQITEEEKENGNGFIEETNDRLSYNSYEFNEHDILNSGKNDHITKARGGGDQRPSSSSSGRDISNNGGRPFRSRQNRDVGLIPHIPTPMYPRGSVNPGGSRNGGDGASGGGHSIDVGEQLALAVIRLQHTMDEVVNRLDSLEVLLQEKQQDRTNQELSNKKIPWSLLGLSPRAAIFVVLWPFVAHWVISIIRKKRQR